MLLRVGSSEVPAEAIRLLQVALDRFRWGRGCRIEVDVLDVIDAGEAEGPVIHDSADGVPDAVVVRALVEDRRRHDERTLVVQERDPSVDVATPPCGRETEREAIGEDSIDPALEDRREAAEVHGRDERQRVRCRDLLLLGQHVLGHPASDQGCDLRLRLAAQRPRGQQALERPTAGIQDPLLEIHQLQDVGRDVAPDVAGRVAGAEHRIEVDRVQVHDLAGVPGVGETGGESLEDTVAERPRVLVRVDRQHLHGVFPPAAPADGTASILSAWGAKRFARRPRPHSTATKISHFFIWRASHPAHASSQRRRSRDRAPAERSWTSGPSSSPLSASSDPGHQVVWSGSVPDEEAVSVKVPSTGVADQAPLRPRAGSVPGRRGG